jgi:hypothetical protein
MAAVAVGRLPEFQAESETMTAYFERLQMYFVANDVQTRRRFLFF